jgi:hypothetical protein
VESLKTSHRGELLKARGGRKTMTRSNAAQGWAAHYGSTNRMRLHEEFDDLGRDHQSAKAASVTPAYAEEPAARLHMWADEADYDEPGAGGCCGEHTNSFPDPRILMSHDWEK